MTRDSDSKITANLSDEPLSESRVPSPSRTDIAFERVLSEVARLPQAIPLQEGSQIGEYRLVRQLGKGTFGTVYHGEHSVIGKQAALKVLNAEFSRDPSIAARFIDEARAVNRIAHPNIVDIFGFGELQDGRKYCVMELLHGETLAEFLENNSCEWPIAAQILVQVAAALDAAHEQRIVHRDLKPDNIFLSRKPSGSSTSVHVGVKLLDFGIARIADGSHSGHGTASGVVLGTPAYMSPEQCRGSHVDRKTDVYALGVVAFEMLTGKLPFTGENALQFIWAHLNQLPPVPTEHNPALPPAVNAVFTRLLSKSADQRPERASDGMRDLLAALGQPATQTSNMTPMPAIGASSKRWGSLFVAAAILAIVAAGFAFRARESEQPRAPIAKPDSASVSPPRPVVVLPGTSSAAPRPVRAEATAVSAPTVSAVKRPKARASGDLEY